MQNGALKMSLLANNERVFFDTISRVLLSDK